MVQQRAINKSVKQTQGQEMTNEEIIKLAIEHTINGLNFDEDGLLRFAKLIAEHERKTCALFCEEKRIETRLYSTPTQSNWLAKKI